MVLTGKVDLSTHRNYHTQDRLPLHLTYLAVISW
nr:MAG TPA: hypothetical protein [Caudoviricetes sp.]